MSSPTGVGSHRAETASHRVVPDEVEAEVDRPGLVERDPVTAAAIALIVAAVLMRLLIAMRGFLALDDFALTGRAADTGLTAGYAFQLLNNHLMPGGAVITWVVTHVFGLVYWPYAVLMAIAELVLGLTFLRLLRNVIGPGWRLLLPLGLLMFSPLTLEVTSWWAVGANMLPMQIAMVLALGAQLKYVQTRRARHLISLAASVVFGLLFFEKSLLIVALVFLATACLFVSGGPVRSVFRTVRRYWPAWLVLIAVSGTYLGLYFWLAPSSSLRNPGSADAVVTFVSQLSGETLASGLTGGPWQWLDAADGAALAAPPLFLASLAAVLVLSVIAVTSLLRPRASRAWLLAALYFLLVAGLLAATRLGGFTRGVEGLAPRYLADTIPVVALCLGLALFGPAGVPATPRRLALPRGLREAGPTLAAVVLLAVGAGTAYSITQWSLDWADKAGRDYLLTAEADLATAPPGTVFFDEAVPTEVVGPLLFPETLQSHFFRPLKQPPVFVTGTAHLSMFDQAGHIRRATVTGRVLQPAPDPSCGYKVTGGVLTTLPLAGPVFEWDWAVRIAYIASADTTATMRLGTGEQTFPVHAGLNEYFFQLSGGGTEVTVSLADPTATLCTNEVSIGNLSPVP